jgi:multiple sugar transport system ATP-binding protein
MNFMPCVLEAKGRDWRLKHDAFALPLKKKVVDWIRKKGTRLADAHEVVLGIRPEDITLRRAKKGEGGMKVEVYISEPLGSDVIVDILLGRQKLKVLTDAKYEGKPGETMYMEVDQDAMQLFDARSTRALL